MFKLHFCKSNQINLRWFDISNQINLIWFNLTGIWAISNNSNTSRSNHYVVTIVKTCYGNNIQNIAKLSPRNQYIMGRMYAHHICAEYHKPENEIVKVVVFALLVWDLYLLIAKNFWRLSSHWLKLHVLKNICNHM